MKKIAQFLDRNKRHIATLALVLGFLVDTLVFRNIDLTLSIAILSGYLVLAASSILALASHPRSIPTGFLGRVREWLPVVHQYATGNLLSAFLILYFSSGSLSQSWPFLFIVAIAILGNELITTEKYSIPFQTTLFFLNLSLFFALVAPILLNSLSVSTFLISIIVSLLVFTGFLGIGYVLSRAFATHLHRVIGGVVVVVLVVVGMYFTSVIPPIPLSVKSIGFYHSVTKVGDTYVSEDEAREPYERFFDIGGITLHLAPGEPAYVYTSIFAPAHFGAPVVHKWEYYDTSEKKWITKNTIKFPITGGRPEGYRGYSLIEFPSPGKWRVSVTTTAGAVIGRSTLNIIRVATPVAISQNTI
ncbi:DUF2914 domain-containing protein [Patescibacteria group bacterium]|nr:MAG: DUF2914 domain-containing protein [Patescibacteria group bacterium]